MALTSLHYYFPWAMRSLVKWTAFCAASGRASRLHVDPAPWFAVVDDPGLDYRAKLSRYQQLADAHFERQRYEEFCAEALPHIDELVLEWVSSPDFDRVLRETVQATYPAAEHERFLAHFRGLVGLWVADETTLKAARG